MQEVAKAFYSISEKIPKDYKKACLQKWYYQARFWVDLFGFAVENCKAIEDYNNGNTCNISTCYLKASEFVKDILELRKELFVGKWSKWFSADVKSDIPNLYDYCIVESNNRR